MKDINQDHMKRRVITATIKMCGEAVLLTSFAGLIVAIIGTLRKWNSSLEYSNGFFIAACLVIIGSAFSRLGAGQEWDYFQRLSTESFRDMSPSERANFIINASSSVHLVILGLLSGILLILISAITYYVWPAR